MSDFNWLEIFEKYRSQIIFLLSGAFLIGLGIFFFKSNGYLQSSKIEVLETTTEDSEAKDIVVEMAGAVEHPGVFTLKAESRVEEGLLAAGGLSADADQEWVEKNLNRAAKLIDGQKIYIPTTEEVLGTSKTGLSNPDYTFGDVGGVTQTGQINVNTASQKELESLWGIGPVTAQNIIEQRPYSSVNELLEKKILKQNVFDKNKDLLTVY